MPGPRRTLIAVDLAAPAPRVDFAGTDEVWALVLDAGEAIGLVSFPSPGATPLPEAALRTLVLRAVAPRAAAGRARRRLTAQLERPGTAPPAASVSVVVCTRRRPEHLSGALAALGALDPAPAEVVVVDNDPGAHDVRDLVRAAGARYVREDRPGLNRARDTGLRRAAGEVVVFCDDDCRPPPGWLAGVDEAFADPMVGAVTGPVVPAALDTEAQARFERVASLGRGFEPFAVDWRSASLGRAAGLGVGADLALRRSLALELADAFPGDFEAPTPTATGGDAYALARVLQAGARVVYDPRMWLRHVHRADLEDLGPTLEGYGTGYVAVIAKLVAAHRELGALRGLDWLAGQYAAALRDRATGRAEPWRLAAAEAYVRGGLRGPRRWRRAARAAAPPRGARVQARPAPPAASPPGGPVALRTTVVVPTAERPGPLARCLAALVEQAPPGRAFEVVVADDGRATPVDAGSLPARDGIDVRIVRTGGRGAATARNAGAQAASGDLLLFLDDDVEAVGDLVGLHAAEHERLGRPALVLGGYGPAPVSRGFATSLVTTWWADFFRGRERARELLFTDVVSGHFSIPRAAFAALGGFDARVGSRREDWELGLRAFRDGLDVRTAPGAEAVHAFSTSTRALLRAGVVEGRGDALLAAWHPGCAAGLTLHDRLADRPGRSARGAAGRAFQALYGARRTRPAALGVLDALEWLGLRSAWLRGFHLAHAEAYRRGVRAAGVALPERPAGSPASVAGTDGLPPARAGVPPGLRLDGGADPPVVVLPGDQGWRPELAGRLLAALPAAGWASIVEPHPALGPGERERGPSIARLEAVPAGAGRPRGWTSIRRAALATGAEVVAVALAGREPAEAWLDEVAVALAGPRVGAVAGTVDSDPWPPGPHTLLGAEDWRDVRRPAAPDWVAFRTDWLRRTDPGGSAPQPADPGAGALAAMARVAAAGGLVATIRMPGTVARVGRRVRLRRRWAHAGAQAQAVATLSAGAGETRAPARVLLQRAAAVARARSAGALAGAALDLASSGWALRAVAQPGGASQPSAAGGASPSTRP